MIFRHRDKSVRAASLTLGLLLGAVLSLTGQAAPSRDQYSESEVSVALLYNVTKFVRWPDGTFASDDATLNLCTYTTEDYQPPLRALEKRSVGAHPIHVVELSDADAVRPDCHVLFISSGQRDALQSELKRYRGKPVLTVGNFREFAEKGGMLSLSKNRKRVNIRINATASERAGLEFNAQLLQLATVFKASDGGDSP